MFHRLNLKFYSLAVLTSLSSFTTRAEDLATEKIYFAAMGYTVTDTFRDVYRHTPWSCGTICDKTVRSPLKADGTPDPLFSPDEILPYGYIPTVPAVGKPILFGNVNSATIPVSRFLGPSQQFKNPEAGKVYFIKRIRVEELNRGRAAQSDACLFVFPDYAADGVSNLLNGYEIYCSNFRNAVPGTNKNFTHTVEFPGKGYPIRTGQSFTCGFNFYSNKSGTPFAKGHYAGLDAEAKTLPSTIKVASATDDSLVATDPLLRGYTGPASFQTRPVMNCEVSFEVAREGTFTAADVAIPVRFPRQDVFRAFRSGTDPMARPTIAHNVWEKYNYASPDPTDIFSLKQTTVATAGRRVPFVNYSKSAGSSYYYN
jgi:hypothetical protein